eukprot:7437779-Alexandrium_andersonii.AAC.1
MRCIATRVAAISPPAQGPAQTSGSTDTREAMGACNEATASKASAAAAHTSTVRVGWPQRLLTR